MICEGICALCFYVLVDSVGGGESVRVKYLCDTVVVLSFSEESEFGGKKMFSR